MYFRDIEVFRTIQIEYISVSCMIINSRGHLREILTNYVNYYSSNFSEDYLNLIRTIYEKCLLIEHLSLLIDWSDVNFVEFEKLLGNRQNLKILVLLGVRSELVSCSKLSYVNGEYVLEILIRSAP